MLEKLQNRKESGFTIVEVMIVLAIAGLIILIVFLAVPALQRNSRNTQRDADASRVTSAVNECALNNNGRLTNCVTAANLLNYITVGDNSQLTTIGAASPTAVAVTTAVKCDKSAAAAPGATTGVGVGLRSFAVTYQVETNTGTPITRCIGS